MKYDFESIIERKGKDALAVDGLGMQPGFSPDAPKALTVSLCGSLT